VCQRKNGGEARHQRVERRSQPLFRHGVFAQEDEARRPIGLGLHRGDCVAENSEVDYFVSPGSRGKRGEAGEMSACREAHDADPRRSAVA
jgi:hypothetical protein